MKKIGFTVLSLIVIFAAYAEEEKIAHWVARSTSDKRSWTVAENWADGVVPGLYKTGTVGSRGWTAYIDGGSDWVIATPSGYLTVSNVIVKLGTGVSRLGNATATGYPICFEPGGVFLLDSSYNGNFSIGTGFGMREVDTLYPVVRIRNEAIGKTLTLMRGIETATPVSGFTTTFYPHFRFEGVGNIVFQGGFPGNSGFRPYLELAMDNGAVFSVTNAGSFSNLQTLFVPAGCSAQTLRIDSGSVFSTGSLPGAYQIEAHSDLNLTGDGIYRMNSNGSGGIRVGDGVTVDVSAKIENPAADASFVIGTCDSGQKGIVRFRGENAISANLSISGGATVESTSIGNAGEASSIGSGTSVSLGGDSRLKYIGVGETANRPMTVKANGAVSIEQAGAGKLTLTGDISFNYPSSIRLVNMTTQSAEFSGLVKDLSSNGQQTRIYKQGDGEWIISGANADIEVTHKRPLVFLEGGTLTAGHSRAFDYIKVTGSNTTVKVLDGLSVSTKLLQDGAGSVNVVLGVGSSLVLTNLAHGRAPDWLTLNGCPARVASNGELRPIGGLLLMVR